MNKSDEYWQKRALWYSYVLDDKMRTKWSWNAVEPNLEMRKIGESFHRVGIAHYAALSPILEPRPLACTTEFTEKDDMHPMSGLGSSKKNIFPI